MKKIALTLVLAAFAFSANAQWVVGGQFGFNTNSNRDDAYSIGSTTTTSFNINPKVGYQLNDQFQIGLQILFGYQTNRAYAGANNTYTSTPTSQFGVSPYARWNFGNWKNCTLFLEGQFIFGTSPETTTHMFLNGNETTIDNDDASSYLGLTIVPGMNYKFSEHFSMDLYINIARLAWRSATNAADWTNSGFGIESNLNAQDINTHLTNFSVGFNYHF